MVLCKNRQLVLNWPLRNSVRPFPPQPERLNGPLLPSTKNGRSQGFTLAGEMVAKPEQMSGVPLVLNPNVSREDC